MRVSNSSEEDLRRLYLDWCSTQVAKRFLELSLDEVWLRSHLAASLPPEQAAASPSIPAIDRIPSYLDLVRRTALAIAQEMELPSFPDWRERYLEKPEAYAVDILGS